MHRTTKAGGEVGTDTPSREATDQLKSKHRWHAPVVKSLDVHLTQSGGTPIPDDNYGDHRHS